eukprot:RCo030318
MQGYLFLCRAKVWWQKLFFVVDQKALSYSVDPLSAISGSISLKEAVVAALEEAPEGLRFRVTAKGKEPFELRAETMELRTAWLAALCATARKMSERPESRADASPPPVPRLLSVPMITIEAPTVASQPPSTAPSHQRRSRGAT